MQMNRSGWGAFNPGSMVRPGFLSPGQAPPAPVPIRQPGLQPGWPQMGWEPWMGKDPNPVPIGQPIGSPRVPLGWPAFTGPRLPFTQWQGSMNRPGFAAGWRNDDRRNNYAPDDEDMGYVSRYRR